MNRPRRRLVAWLLAITGMVATPVVILYVQSHTPPPDAGRLAADRAQIRALLARMGATAAVQVQTCSTRPSDMANILAVRHHASCNGTSATLLPAAARPRIEAVLRAAHYTAGDGAGEDVSWTGGAYYVRLSRDTEPLGTTTYDVTRPLWRRLRASHRGGVLVEIQSFHEDRSCLRDTCPGYEGQVEFAGLVEF